MLLPDAWKHGLPSASFLIGVFGSVIPVKRLENCIKALGTLRARDVDCMMVVVVRLSTQGIALNSTASFSVRT